MLDKTLLLKGVAGVATLGGVVGGGIVFKDQIGSAISGSSVDKGGNREETGRKQGGNREETNLVADNQSREDQDPKSRTGNGLGATVSSASTPDSKEDSYGIPKRCNVPSTTSCDLTEEELKKIKFEGLGDTGDVTVENFPEEGKKISLTIDSSDSTKKKYIFTNTSDEEVKIKRGDENSVTLKAGKTKFTLVGEKLKEKELGEYGEPKDCTSSCTLTSTDLEDINFKVLDEGTGDTTVSPNAGKVSLEIKTVDNKNRYIFSNSSSSEITIKKGNGNTVTLTSNKKTQFIDTDSEKKLSKLSLDDYGVPSSCTSSCTLTADDLGEIKFEELGGTGTVSPTTDKTVSLTIDSTNKRYTFTTSSSPITIKKDGASTPTLTLSIGKNRFKGDTDKLKKIVVDKYGIPSDCKSDCKLTEDDLKEVKFPNFKDNQVSEVTGLDGKTISLNIKGEDYTFADDEGKQVTIKRGNDSVTLTASQGTEFHAENGKLVKGKKKSEAEIFNEKIKGAGFPCGTEGEECCKFQDNNTSVEIDCKLTKEEFEKLKFKELDGGEVDESTLDSGIGNEFKVKIKKIADDEKGNYSSGADLKFIFDGLSNSFAIQKKDDTSKTIYLKKDSDTEFIVNSSNQLERAWTRQRLGEKLGLSCSGDGGVTCTITESKKINLITSNPSQKYEGMSKSASGGDKFQVTTGDNYKEGYRFKVKDSDITLSNSSGVSQTLTKGCCYEAKWDVKKWWLAYKENSCK